MAVTKYKLHYFDMKSIGEGIRFIFHFAGIDYEDYRINRQAYNNRDPSVPRDMYKTKSDQVPVLEVTENGETWLLSQSLAICRFLARRYDLVGKTEKHHAECDEIADALMEPFVKSWRCWYPPEEEVRAEALSQLIERDIPRVLGSLDERLKKSGGKHMVGDGWTWADFSVAWILAGIKGYAPPTASVIDEKCPNLVSLARSVEEIPSIAAYIAKRPVTQI